MSVKQLIVKFSTRTEIPIDVSEVIAEIRERGIKDEIYPFWDINLDPSSLRGYIKHDEYPIDESGAVKRVAEITYGKAGHEMERLICCKELLHILDPDEYRVGSPELVDKLVSKIVLPPDLVDPATDGIHALSDRVAITEAVAVLFPYAVRQVFLPLYASGKISLAEIADHTEIPTRYAAMVMSETWEEIHAIFSS